MPDELLQALSVGTSPRYSDSISGELQYDDAVASLVLIPTNGNAAGAARKDADDSDAWAEMPSGIPFQRPEGRELSPVKSDVAWQDDAPMSLEDWTFLDPEDEAQPPVLASAPAAEQQPAFDHAQPQTAYEPQTYVQPQAAYEAQLYEQPKAPYEQQPQAAYEQQPNEQPQAAYEPQKYEQPQAAYEPEPYEQPQAAYEPQPYAQPQVAYEPQPYAQPQAA